MNRVVEKVDPYVGYETYTVAHLLVGIGEGEGRTAFIGRKNSYHDWELFMCTGECVFPAERPWDSENRSTNTFDVLKWVDVKIHVLEQDND